MSMPVTCSSFLCFCFALSAILQGGESRAVVSVHLLAYRNAENRKTDGLCCNVGKWNVCTAQCSPTFSLCLDQADSKKEDLSGCSMGKVKHSGVFANRSRIDFTSTVGRLKNPLAWMLDKWPGAVKLIIRIGHAQDNHDDKLIAMWSQIQAFVPRLGIGLSQIRHFKNDQYGISLDARVNVTCAQYYYGVDCSEFCQPSIQDHYTCDRHGRKVCHEGWEGIDCTVNHDDCRDDPCKNGGVCHDLVNGFTCLCADGYEGSRCKRDIDECGQSGMCRNGNCVNKHGSYTCECFKGYSGADCSIFTDVCDSSPCANGGTCENIMGHFFCHCPKQYKGQDCRQDVDECQENNPCSVESVCINKYGSYECNCQPGWTGQLCNKDIDECAEGIPCFIGATCINTLGSYRCECPSTHTGPQCMLDVNECTSLPCQNNGICRNIVGGFFCTCADGYTGKVCNIDVNECDSLIKPCQNGGICLNSPGSFKCRCNVGYTGTGCEIDIDECKEEIAVCKNGASCINLNGSFKCSCTEFWQGAVCDINVDECLSSPCGNNGKCVNVAEGYNCECHAGWNGDSCNNDINECKASEGVCKNGGTCFNTAGSFWCDCLAGWKGQSCDQDIDECLSLNPCHNHGQCQNTAGSFYCDCGIQWIGQSCDVDVNECEETPDICGNNGKCINLLGDFWCFCDPGFTGSYCDQDVEECTVHPDVCIHTEVNIPFYLAGKVPKHERRLINDGISALLKETHLTEGKNISVISSFASGVGSRGEKFTKVHPVVKLNGRTLTDKEVVALLSRVAHKFSNFIKFPLFIGEVGNQFSADLSEDEFSKSWIAAPIIAALLLFVLLLAVLVNLIRRYRKFFLYKCKAHCRKEEFPNTNSTVHVNAAYTEDTEEDTQSEETKSHMSGPDTMRKDKLKFLVNPMYGDNGFSHGTISIGELSYKARTEIDDTSSTCSGDGQPDGHPSASEGKSFAPNNNHQAEVTVHHGWTRETMASLNSDSVDPREIEADLADGYQHISDIDTISHDDALNGDSSNNTHRYETVDCSGFLLDERDGNLVPNGQNPGNTNSLNTLSPQEDALNYQVPLNEGSADDISTTMPEILEQEVSQNVVVRQTVVQMEPIIKQVTRQERRSVEVRQQLIPQTQVKPNADIEVAMIRKSAPSVLMSDRQRLAAEEDEYDRRKNFRYIDEATGVSVNDV